MTDLPATQRSLGWAIAAVTALVLAAYAPSVRDGFVLDDSAAIARHPGVTHPSFAGLVARDFWGGTRLHPHTPAWRPLTTASFALDWRLGGGFPTMFHVTNILLHLAVTLSLLLFLWRLDGLRRWTALAATLLFALHPLHVEAVTGLVGRADVLCALLSLVTFWLHRKSEGAATVVAPLAFFCALLAKESALLVLPLLVVVELRRESHATLPSRALRWLGYAAMIALYLVLRRHALGSWHAAPPTDANPLAHANPTSRMLTALALFSHALGLFALPFSLLPDYGRAVVVPLEHATPDVWIGAALVVALVALLCFAWRRPGPLADAIAFLLVPGLAAVGLFAPLPVAFAERWWYLPSLGACVMATSLGEIVASRAHAFLPASILALALAVFALVTFRRAGEWRDDFSLFASCVATRPDSALCQYGLGAVLDGESRDADALVHYQRAETIDPSWAEPHAAAAAILARAGRTQEAEAAFAKMLAAGGGSHIARLNYARFLMRTGHVAEGRRLLDSTEGRTDEP
jgi:protein O-mannosyl-transferase